MSDTIDSLIESVGELASLPGVCSRVLEMTDDPNVSASLLADVINQDPALTVQLLRMANSPHYGCTREVDTVSRAVSVIGMQQLRDVVVGASAVKAFEDIPNELVTLEDFWMHSLYCGIAARILAERLNNPRAESVFVAGLLHDIGQLVIFHERPEESRQALLMTLEDPDEPEIDEAERRVLHFDHAEVGGRLAEHWALPALLQECILYHHVPERATAFQQEAYIVHVANILACMAELDEVDEEELRRIHQQAWAEVGLEHDLIVEVMHEAQAQFNEVHAMYLN